MRYLDVLTISDFRLPGGTSHSTAQELVIHKEMGLTTGLLQVQSPLSSKALVWSQVITRELAPGQVEPIPPADPVHATIALIRHPVAAGSMPDLSRRVRVDKALLIANQPAVRPDGEPEYDVRAITERVHEHLGIIPIWAPIGPVVRKSLAGLTDDVPVLPHDWTNIFAQVTDPPHRSSFDVNRPRIGRHSRPQPAKWPESVEQIEQAYPTSGEYSVSILGGAKPATDLLGIIPDTWKILPFGSIPPMEFLATIDFWVYFHHSNWSEAYGRAIMEALWSGAVVILPEYLRMTFGDAAVYGTPVDVRPIISEFCRGDRNFYQQSAMGQAFARAHSPRVHSDRMHTLLASAGPRSKSDVQTEQSAASIESLRTPRVPVSTTKGLPTSRFDFDRRPRALFLTSNGAGMGHLTRMLGLARVVAHDIDPIFFSMSQGVSVVAAAGFPYEYVPFNSAIQTKSPLWHEYLRTRLLTTIDHYRANIVLFDGTWPYRGMLEALAERDVMCVWIRRGMWKSNISPEQLQNAPHFDLVIEPGEHAHEYDSGATTRVMNARVVAPMTVLSQSEILPREAALAELGLPDSRGRRYVLITLGAGNINDLTTTQATALEAIGQHPGWEPILTRAPIAATIDAAKCHTIRTFPLARYTRAFDFAVSAAGYNSFAEWMSGGLPAVWIPNLSTITDDQDARARWATDHGYGIRASESEAADLRAAVERMCDDATRSAMAQRLSALAGENGTAEAGRLVSDTWQAWRMNQGMLT